MRSDAAVHSHRAHTLLTAEEALYEAYRKVRYFGVAYRDPKAVELANRLKRDWQNAGAKRRRIMRSKP